MIKFNCFIAFCIVDYLNFSTNFYQRSISSGVNILEQHKSVNSVVVIFIKVLLTVYKGLPSLSH